MLDFAGYRPLTYAVPRLHQSLAHLSRLALLVTLLLLLQPLLAWLGGRIRTSNGERCDP
jgi:hypothetical protein